MLKKSKTNQILRGVVMLMGRDDHGSIEIETPHDSLGVYNVTGVVDSELLLAQAMCAGHGRRKQRAKCDDWL